MTSEQKDIVTQLRAVLHNDRSVELMARDAADEIERLRGELVSKADELAATVRELRKVQDERDDARRENCRMWVYHQAEESLDDETLEHAAMILAERRGWDCFQEYTQ